MYCPRVPLVDEGDPEPEAAIKEVLEIRRQEGRDQEDVRSAIPPSLVGFGTQKIDMGIGLGFGKMCGPISIETLTEFRVNNKRRKRRSENGIEEPTSHRLKGMATVVLGLPHLASSASAGVDHVKEYQWTAQHLLKLLQLGVLSTSLGGKKQGVNSRPRGNEGHPRYLHRPQDLPKRLRSPKENTNGRGLGLVPTSVPPSMALQPVIYLL